MHTHNWRARLCLLFGLFVVMALTSLPVQAITGPTSTTTGNITLTWRYTEPHNTAWCISYDLNIYGGRFLNQSSTRPISEFVTALTLDNLPKGTYRVELWMYCMDNEGFPLEEQVGSHRFTVAGGTPPSAPTRSYFSDYGNSAPNGSYTYRWPSVPGATSYIYQRVGASNREFLVFENHVAFSGYREGRYQYRVKACNAGGCSDYTPTQTIDLFYRPALPGAFEPVDTPSDGNLVLRWGASPGANYYLLEDRSGVVYEEVYQGATQFTFQNLPTGRYDFIVAACKTPETCSDYQLMPYTITVTDLQRPTFLARASEDTDGTFPVRWHAVPGAHHYQLEQRLDGGQWQRIASTMITATTFTIRGARHGVWEFRVSMCHADNTCSPASEPYRVVVAEPTPRRVIYTYTDHLGSPVAEGGPNGR